MCLAQAQSSQPAGCFNHIWILPILKGVPNWAWEAADYRLPLCPQQYLHIALSQSKVLMGVGSSGSEIQVTTAHHHSLSVRVFCAGYGTGIEVDLKIIIS